MPDLNLITAAGSLRVFELLHDAKPVLLHLGEPGGLDITPWADRVKLIDASCKAESELLVLGVVNAPTAVLIRPGHLRRTVALFNATAARTSALNAASSTLSLS